MPSDDPHAKTALLTYLSPVINWLSSPASQRRQQAREIRDDFEASPICDSGYGNAQVIESNTYIEDDGAADHLAYPAVYVRFDTIEDSVDVAGNIREFAAGREWDLVCVEDYTRESDVSVYVQGFVIGQSEA